MLSGRGLCDGPIPCPEEFYRLWCVIVCDLENLKNKEAKTTCKLVVMPEEEEEEVVVVVVVVIVVVVFVVV